MKRPDFRLETLETDTPRNRHPKVEKSKEKREPADRYVAGETARYWYSISGLFRLVGACISLWGSTGARATALVKRTSSRDKYATTRTTGAPPAAQTRASVGLAAAP